MSRGMAVDRSLGFRRMAREAFPRLYSLARRLRYLGRQEPVEPQTSAILERLCYGDLRVLAGPFAGMKYIPASGSGILPKIAGCYEMEVHEAVAESFARNYRRIVNVGCGEGYYTVGYALKFPRAEIHAFDNDLLARQRLRSLARANGVAGRIRVGGACHPEDLQALLRQPGALVVCDCEGCEAKLLDPAQVPGLGGADLLVELHDFVIAGISATLPRRFQATHEVQILEMCDRDGLEWRPLDPLDPEQRRLATWEGRPAGMRWAWIKSRAW